METRMDLPGHRSGKITTHYNAPELESLIAASEKACRNNSRNSCFERNYEESLEWLISGFY